MKTHKLQKLLLPSRQTSLRHDRVMQAPECVEFSQFSAMADSCLIALIHQRALFRCCQGDQVSLGLQLATPRLIAMNINSYIFFQRLP